MEQKWYKQFWPWFLIALPGSVVIASFITIYIAAQDPDGLVRGDYYKNGLAINENLERQQAAIRHGLVAELTAEGDVLQLQLHASEEIEAPNLILSVMHPTRSGQDREVIMRNEGEGRFRAALPKLKQGAWNIMLQPVSRDWFLEGRIDWPVLGKTILAAK